MGVSRAVFRYCSKGVEGNFYHGDSGRLGHRSGVDRVIVYLNSNINIKQYDKDHGATKMSQPSFTNRCSLVCVIRLSNFELSFLGKVCQNEKALRH